MLDILCVLDCYELLCLCLKVFCSKILLKIRFSCCLSIFNVINIIGFRFLWIFVFASIRMFFELVQCRERNNIIDHLKFTYFLRFFNAIFVWWRAAHGLGTSKNKQSAFMFTLSTENPSETTSLQVEVIFFFYKFSKNYFVIYALSLLN